MKTGRWLVLIGICGIVVACGGDKATAPDSPFALLSGTYVLSILGGVAPPAQIIISGTPVIIQGATMAITTGGSYTQSAVVQTTAGTSTVTDQGTVSVNGTVLTLTSSRDGSTETAVVSGNAIIVSDGGYLWTYNR